MYIDVSSDVMDVARKYLHRVKKSGPDNIEAVCPFHVKADGTPEKNPSFRMSLSKGVFICLSCQSKGNLFTFLRDIGLSRTTIEHQYRFLIDQAATNQPPPPNPLKPLVFELAPIEEAVLGLFDYCPIELLDEGFTKQTLQHFEIGYDSWHQCITYPLRDLKGRLVGISGRRPAGMRPRYKIYDVEYGTWDLPPRGELDRRAILWNADKVFPAVYFEKPQDNVVVVVEGFKALMWLWQCGIKNVVALMGTYLSWEHKWILERLGCPVYLFLDNNFAGRNGTIAAAESLSKSLAVHIVEYPARLVDDEDAQPDNLSPTEAVEAVAIAPSYLNWLLKFADHGTE